MGMNLTPEDLQDLLARAMATAMQQVQPAAPTAGAGAAAIVGRLGPCELGRDKLRRYKRFKDWVGEAESKMRLLGITTSQQKASFVQSRDRAQHILGEGGENQMGCKHRPSASRSYIRRDHS